MLIELVTMRYEREEGARVRLEQSLAESRGEGLVDAASQLKRLLACLFAIIFALLTFAVFAFDVTFNTLTILLFGVLFTLIIIVFVISRSVRRGIVQILEFNTGMGRLDDVRQINGKIVYSKQMSVTDLDVVRLDVFDQQTRVVWKLYVFSKNETKPYLLLFKQYNKTGTNSVEILRLKEFLVEITEDLHRIVKIRQPSVQIGVNYDEKRAIEATVRASNERSPGLFMLGILFLVFGSIGSILGGGWLAMEWGSIFITPLYLTGAHILVPIFIVCSVLLVIGLALFIQESKKKVI
jgi:hypothetical protein